MKAPLHPSQEYPSGHSWQASRPRVDWTKLRQVRLRDFALRFLFGGTISVLAALLGHWVNPRFGGLFTTFPVILLASLSLIGSKEGSKRAVEDDQGSVAGALALIACTVLLVFVISWLPGILTLGAAFCLWLILAILLYFLGVAGGWLRSRGSQDQERPSIRPPDQQ